MKITVNKDICIGCGLCVSIAPELFKLDENFKCEPKEGAVNDLKAAEAKENCPVEAIQLE